MGNKIDLKELNNFKGDVCLYSLKLEDNLGSKIKNKFNNLFINNAFSYNNSLSFKTTCKLILIDGDDFAPTKISGLVKSYDVPVVVFVGNEQKKAKLLETLLVEPTVVDKNTGEGIDCSKDVERNVEEKRKRDAEREALREKNPTVVTVEEEKEIKAPKEEPIQSQDFFFSSGMLSMPKKEEVKEEVKEEKNLDEILESKNLGRDNSSKKDDFDKNLFKNEDIKEEPKEELPKSFSFFESEELEKSFDFAKEKRIVQETKNKLKKEEDENSFYCKDKKLVKIGCYTNDMSVDQMVKKVFKDVETIDVLNNRTKYDIVIVDITFTLVDRAINFLDYQNCPAIIIAKSLNTKKEEFLAKNYLDVYFLEKPLSISSDIIKTEFKKYLNSFDYNKNNTKRTINNPNYIRASRNEKSEEKSPNTIEKNPRMYRKPSISDVKKEINQTNKRQDKVESLESIYKRLGLDDIVAFNSNINKSIFICNDNKVIKYTPAGYFIEFRIKRLETQGMNRNQINAVLKGLEDADIKYQKRILQEIEEKRFSNK